MALEGGKGKRLASRRIIERVIWGLNAVTVAVQDDWAANVDGFRAQERQARGFPNG